MVKSFARALAIVSVVITFAGCSLYRSEERDSFNSSALAGAPARPAFTLTLLSCSRTDLLHEPLSQTETIEISRARHPLIDIKLTRPFTKLSGSTNASMFSCTLRALAVEESTTAAITDKELSDACRPLVEQALSANH